MKRIVFASALSAAAASLLSCSATEAHHPAPEAAPLPVTVGVAHDEPLAILYRASGTVRGRNTTVLTSKTMGYVRAVRVRSGDRVTAGQPLVLLEANDVRASVARARAGLDQSRAAKTEAENALEAARIAAKLARSSHERAAALLKDNAIPQQQYDDAEARWRSTAAQEQMAEARIRSLASSIDEAKAALGEAQITLGYADIVAPFAGRVLERRVDPGTLATPGTPLLVIGDEETLRVEAPIEESRADQVRVGDEADIAIDTLPHAVVGRVGEIVPSVDIASRAFLVKIDLPAEVGMLRSGTFARVSFHVGVRPRLVVPTAAISSFGALDRVFIVDGTHARLRMITRGDTQGEWTEILSGLSPNERVALSSEPLRDDSPVEVRR